MHRAEQVGQRAEAPRPPRARRARRPAARAAAARSAARSGRRRAPGSVGQHPVELGEGLAEQRRLGLEARRADVGQPVVAGAGAQRGGEDRVEVADGVDVAVGDLARVLGGSGRGHRIRSSRADITGRSCSSAAGPVDRVHERALDDARRAARPGRRRERRACGRGRRWSAPSSSSSGRSRRRAPAARRGWPPAARRRPARAGRQKPGLADVGPDDRAVVGEPPGAGLVGEEAAAVVARTGPTGRTGGRRIRRRAAMTPSPCHSPSSGSTDSSSSETSGPLRTSAVSGTGQLGGGAHRRGPPSGGGPARCARRRPQPQRGQRRQGDEDPGRNHGAHRSADRPRPAQPVATGAPTVAAITSSHGVARQAEGRGRRASRR